VILRRDCTSRTRRIGQFSVQFLAGLHTSISLVQHTDLTKTHCNSAGIRLTLRGIHAQSQTEFFSQCDHTHVLRPGLYCPDQTLKNAHPRRCLVLTHILVALFLTVALFLVWTYFDRYLHMMKNVGYGVRDARPSLRVRPHALLDSLRAAPPLYVVSALLRRR
jgi:hypothetical protein